MNKIVIILILLGMGLLTTVKLVNDQYGGGAFNKEIDKIKREWKGNPNDTIAIEAWKRSFKPGYKAEIIKRPSYPLAILPIKEKEKSFLNEIKEFLAKDDVSDQELGMGAYQCTQFSRDLSGAANKENMPIGGIILGNKPDLSGYSNHALNYIIIDNIFYIINPESDFIIPWSEYIHRNKYKYYKIYPNGELLPSRWSGGLDNTGVTSDLL